MVNFKSRYTAIKCADRITRTVNSVYPHISESRVKEYIDRRIFYADYNDKSIVKLNDLLLKYSQKFKGIRSKITSGIDLLKNIINSLKDEKIGNCYEKARLAEIIGKINGLNNIYPMKLLVSRNKSGVMLPLDHVVAVISEDEVAVGEKYDFKNNSAVILDPWLGITEFSGTYIEKLKNDFVRFFPNIPDNDFNMNYYAKTSKNLKEFNKKRKTECYNPQIKFMLHDDGIAKDEEIIELRRSNPELIIK